MADVFSSEKRSSVMQRVKAKGNITTEIKLMDYFKHHQITGWRRNYDVKGHPDFVFLKQRIAIFVDGCFWHGHDCRNTRPKAYAEYWNAKRQRNIDHDLSITAYFQRRGWTVIRIWECELLKKNHTLLEKKLSLINQGNGLEKAKL